MRMSKTCKICNSIIDQRKTYCSRKCKNKAFYLSKKVEKVCKRCKKVFLGTQGQKCCSEKCATLVQKKYIKTCPICEKKFKARGNRIYCSNSCYRYANSENHGYKTTICIVCNRTYRELSTNLENPICSGECKSKLIETLVDRSLNRLKQGGLNPVEK